MGSGRIKHHANTPCTPHLLFSCPCIGHLHRDQGCDRCCRQQLQLHLQPHVRFQLCKGVQTAEWGRLPAKRQREANHRGRCHRGDQQNCNGHLHCEAGQDGHLKDCSCRLHCSDYSSPYNNSSSSIRNFDCTS